MTQHTPGPWTYNQLGDIFGPDNKAIATTDAVPKTFNNDMANARLIAAAPELLEAAIEMVEGKCLGPRPGGIMDGTEAQKNWDKINKLRAAIAKAKQVA